MTHAQINAVLEENKRLRAACIAARLQLALAFGEMLADERQAAQTQPAQQRPIVNIFKRTNQHGR